MIGKLGAAAAFAVIYVFSAELYPTVVRNAGMGASSCCARIGGMVAPYIADIVSFIFFVFFCLVFAIPLCTSVYMCLVVTC